jgi:hypothetical protein
MSPSEFLNYSHAYSAIPALLISFIAVNLIFIIVGIAFSESKKNFLKVWFLALIISSIVFLSLLYLPNSVQFIYSLFKE